MRRRRQQDEKGQLSETVLSLAVGVRPPLCLLGEQPPGMAEDEADEQAAGEEKGKAAAEEGDGRLGTDGKELTMAEKPELANSQREE